MLTVAEVVKQTMEDLNEYSDQELYQLLRKMGMNALNCSREEMISELVDAEVYAFTH